MSSASDLWSEIYAESGQMYFQSFTVNVYSYERNHKTDSNSRIESELFLRINFVN